MTHYIDLLPDELVAKILAQFLKEENHKAFSRFASTCKRINIIANNLHYLEEWRAAKRFVYNIGDSPALSLPFKDEKKSRIYHPVFWHRLLTFKYVKFNELKIVVWLNTPSYTLEYFDFLKNIDNESNLYYITKLDLRAPCFSVAWLDKLLSLLRNLDRLYLYQYITTLNVKETSTWSPQVNRKVLKRLDVIRSSDLIFYYLKEHCPAYVVNLRDVKRAKAYISRNVDVVEDQRKPQGLNRVKNHLEPLKTGSQKSLFNQNDNSSKPVPLTPGLKLSQPLCIRPQDRQQPIEAYGRVPLRAFHQQPARQGFFRPQQVAKTNGHRFNLINED